MSSDNLKSSEEVAQLKDAIVTWLEERKAGSITVLDIASISTVADYFVIATGTSQVHLNSIAEHVRMGWSDLCDSHARVEGKGSEWVLIDMGFVVLHLMSERAREFYDLEGLWSPELWQASSNDGSVGS